MQHLLILIGISGSGKSTFARQFVQDKPNYLRLNRDELRRSVLPVSLGEYWKWDEKRKNRIERLVSDLEQTALHSALDGGWNVVMDNTHLRARYIHELLKRVESREIEVTFRLLEVPLDEAIRRDANRPDSVGETAIREQSERLKQFRKQFDVGQRLIFPKANPVPVPTVQSSNLPKCILVDIDGTVAKIHDRSPFDWLKVGRDKPNPPVLNVVRAMHEAGYAIIFMSGRDSLARPETINWLWRHMGWREGTDYQLFMRKQNDMRKDAIVKRELFDAHIRGRYFVEVILDDRDQVVALWRRDLGLPCFQVDYGNF
ncbi:AAA family ATPase [Rudanella paleaurantiibacter]|uniref:AAA family ATPase n=1 Tax=Rudanella paleaurantiibacter TaxID=2614655 RepID=A0A7J5U1B4_9BACT|nr:AAA family ATPase [Rudanella paleaurantiibacter]KAB7731469.1 AAA family ATPase [Rudanella paleaurantiibacter]